MPLNDNQITILILAAGSASRLGRPKQLLQWQDSTLLQNTIDTAKKAHPKKIGLVLGAYYNQILNEVDTQNITVYHNKLWKRGMGQSIAYGLKMAIEDFPDTEGILILLADQPQINANHLKQMMAVFQREKKKIVATAYKNKPFSVPALFHSCFFEELTGLQGDQGAQQLIKANQTRVTTIKLDFAFEDIDTWEDYERLYRMSHK